MSHLSTQVLNASSLSPLYLCAEQPYSSHKRRGTGSPAATLLCTCLNSPPKNFPDATVLCVSPIYQRGESLTSSSNPLLLMFDSCGCRAERGEFGTPHFTVICPGNMMKGLLTEPRHISSHTFFCKDLHQAFHSNLSFSERFQYDCDL